MGFERTAAVIPIHDELPKRAPRHACRVCEDTGFILYAERQDGVVIRLKRVLACGCDTGRARNRPSRDRDGTEHPGSAVCLFSESPSMLKFGWKAVPTSAGATAMMLQDQAQGSDYRPDRGGF